MWWEKGGYLGDGGYLRKSERNLLVLLKPVSENGIKIKNKHLLITKYFRHYL
jgi:hypothetical protein